MAWRLAKSLDVLRRQIDEKWPNRSKANDGTIGDTAHASRKSEHNPDANGVVRALDITNDPAHGVSSDAIAHALIDSKDPRILYIISNGRIANSQVSSWVWRPYNGSNPHDRHFHISVVPDSHLYDSTLEWRIGPKPVIPEQPKMSSKYYHIVATVFGGPGDEQTGAYGPIDWDKAGAALPYRFTGTRPHVRVWNGDVSLVCPIVDVGPWNINDPYWTDGRRPQAETGRDTTGRKTNLAGIDLTPAAARILGIKGKGMVDWEFTTGVPSFPDVPKPVIITKKENKVPAAPMAAGGILAAILAFVGTHWTVAILAGAIIAATIMWIMIKNKGD